MHDVAAFEAAGLPSVALLSSEFRAQASYQARGLGLARAVKLFVRHPISDQSASALRAKADAVFADVVRGLTEEGYAGHGAGGGAGGDAGGDAGDVGDVGAAAMAAAASSA